MDLSSFVAALTSALQDTQVRACLSDIVGESFRQELISLKAELKKKDSVIEHLDRRIESLESQNDALEQYTRRNSIRVTGLPEVKHEDILDRTLKIVNEDMEVNPPISIMDIDRVHRVGRRNPDRPSLPHDNQELSNCLQLTETNFFIISLTETWLTESNKTLYEIPNYNSIHSVRVNQRGGVVSIYTDSFLNVKHRPDLNIYNNDIKSLFLEILPTGDFNIDISQYPNNIPACDFLDLMYSESYIPLINIATIQDRLRSTIIDNIFTNNIDREHSSAVIYS
ncbi:hypothetical protein CAPTEDRAFT_188928 [Capitella teleta]|uniref:Uncharacterized protein n=1 Tax=Capitella teleta TaxID=283909 RepID=R7U399_CAPTE|nr:hypothetical protein CAPTEDRAFT_188928 [Capitella teleta]|eukprot:ELU00820.1 hypothetical protein CAPTEDRAFT_188928 [Capitella teleta]